MRYISKKSVRKAWHKFEMDMPMGDWMDFREREIREDIKRMPSNGRFTMAPSKFWKKTEIYFEFEEDIVMFALLRYGDN